LANVNKLFVRAKWDCIAKSQRPPFAAWVLGAGAKFKLLNAPLIAQGHWDFGPCDSESSAVGMDVKFHRVELSTAN